MGQERKGKFLEVGQVVKNEQLASCVWKVTMITSAAARAILPGQFVHLQVDDGKLAMLRRPFSVFFANAETGEIEIIYEVKGKGTEMMTSWQPGKTASMIAPLGNSWLSTIEGADQEKIERALIVGGGVGAAPLYMLAKNLTGQGAAVDVVLGARTSELLVLKGDYGSLAVNSLTCATDDGSFGFDGFCTIPAQNLLAQNDYDYVATCGPAPVMKAVAAAAESSGVRHVEVSMEERMACGVGACKTCVVETVNGKVKSCECGPVFAAEVISW